MEKIVFDNVVPAVFTHRGDLSSEVWRQSVTFAKGHKYLIEAVSGRGKSTFCSYITGYRHDFSGRISFDEADTRSLSVADWVDTRKNHISHLFQELRLFPELTALENVEIKNKLCKGGFKSRKEIEEWFDRLGIADKMGAKIGRMSFGQQQRVAMIRALAQPFDFILADEPVSHLDDANSRAMGDIMIGEANRQGAGVIVTSIGKHIDMDYERTLRL